jgi:hypothetical protein
MWAAFAGFFRLGVFENVAEEFGVHFFYRDFVDFLEVADIPQLEIVKGKTIEAIA